MDHRFPNVGDLQQAYRDQVGPLIVRKCDGDLNLGTLGGAFDWMVRFLVHPEPDLRLAVQGAMLSRLPGLRGAFSELTASLGFGRGGTASFQGPVRGSSLDHDVLARGCWVLALFTEVVRVGVKPGSPLRYPSSRGVRGETLLGLAPDAAITQLDELRAVTESVLLPTLARRKGRWDLGPTFDGSHFLSGDADLIAAGLLLEVKTSLGRKGKDGMHRPTLDKQTVLQLAGYTLMDFTNRYEISELGVFSARYRSLITWQQSEFFNTLGNRHVDLAAEREAFSSLLRNM